MKYLLAIIITSISYQLGIGQSFEVFECPVSIDGKELKYPFTGGFTAPQFSSCDFNQDGIEDIYVYDRSGIPMVFLYDGSGGSDAHTYTEEYNASFPTMENWSLMRDYNRDGIMDIFSNPSQGISGIQLHKGSIVNGEWSFEAVRSIGGDRPDKYLYVPDGGGGWTPLSVLFTDIPDIIDVDGDDDLDILTFDPGGAYVTFYRNLQVENNLPVDSLLFEVGDFCFGKFKESGVSADIFLSTNGLCAQEIITNDSPPPKAHAGSTVMAFDNDDDGDLELVLGDLVSNSIVYLENGGENGNNLITSVDLEFPNYDVPVDMPIFLGSFNVDVDGDDLKDLLVSPNVIGSVQNVENILYYKNTGNANSRFSYRQNDFLSEETIDFGSFVAPAFVDYNADGLIDIVVASGGIFNGTNAELRLYLLENIGTKALPSYSLVDDDYLEFSEYNNTSRNPAPTFGDLDGDGDTDLLIGDEEGYLYYFENTAGAGEPLSYGTPIYQYKDILVGSKARPYMADLNDDGLMDIIVGQRKTAARDEMTGNINYFQNIGEVGMPDFDGDILNSPNIFVLGAMTTREGLQTSAAGASVPFMHKINDIWHFFVGAQEGFISHFTYDGSDINGVFPRVDSTFGNIDIGRWSSPTMADVDDDNLMEILIGNFRGGLSFYNTNIDSGTSAAADISKEPLKIFPNPTNDILRVESVEFANSSYKIFDINGRTINSGTISNHEVSLSSLTTGVYILEVSQKGQRYIEKIIKI